MKGTFYAKAVVGKDADGNQISGLRKSKEKGTEEFFVLFEITKGEHLGKRYGWDGWLTENTEARVMESLKYCGFTGLGPDGTPLGMEREVQIVLDEESYPAPVVDSAGQPVMENGVQKTETRVRTRVNWVNDPNRAPSPHVPLAGEELKAKTSAFNARFASFQQSRPAAGAPKHDATSFDFGANQAPPSTETSKPAEPPSQAAEKPVPGYG